MPLSVADRERVERALKRTIAKRDGIITQVKLLYDLALKVEHNKEAIQLFRVRQRDVESLRNQFFLDQDSIFDLLLQLQREDEYSKLHVPLANTLSEQYYAIMAIAENV